MRFGGRFNLEYVVIESNVAMHHLVHDHFCDCFVFFFRELNRDNLFLKIYVSYIHMQNLIQGAV